MGPADPAPSTKTILGVIKMAKNASLVQFFVFLGIGWLFADTFIFNAPVALTGTGALLISFAAILVGSWFFWAIGNKGNPNYAGVSPSSPSWRMWVYMIMFSFVFIYEIVALVIVGHDPFSGFGWALDDLLSNKEVLTIVLLPLAMLLEWYAPG